MIKFIFNIFDKINYIQTHKIQKTCDNGKKHVTMVDDKYIYNSKMAYQKLCVIMPKWHNLST